MMTKGVSLIILLVLSQVPEGRTCSVESGVVLYMKQCDDKSLAVGQDFVIETFGSTGNVVIHPKDTYSEGLCFDAGEGQLRSSISLQECQQSGTNKPQLFHWSNHTDKVEGSNLVHTASNLCVSIAHNSAKEGASLDLFNCSQQSNMLWTQHVNNGEIVSILSELCITACSDKPSPSPPAPAPPGPLTAVIDSSAAGLSFGGIWAMSANGAARQLFEYPEPTRSEILDLMFLPATGTRWQALKVEIGGDVESSYGSMSSFKHVPDSSKASFKRGVQWWLMQEAKKRNPNLPLYCLSWGMPYWVGNGTFLSPGGVQYHIDYLQGAKTNYNLTFDLIGIWNEAPWSKGYILELRQALDTNGFQDTGIIAPDGSTDFIDAAAKDTTLADAVAAFGIHAHVLPAVEATSTLGKPYYNSENDLVDGAMPQWGGSNTPGLSWPKAFMQNYIEANGTATMLCPAIHGWNQNLGRHNHGPAFFNDPWSGFYQLGAPFFTQAHWTQFTEIGWKFIDSACAEHGNTVYAALMNPNGTDFSFIVVNQQDNNASINLSLGGTLSTRCGSTLQRRQSTEFDYFVDMNPVTIPCNHGHLALQLPPQSITSISSISSAYVGWAKNYHIPARERFPLPYTDTWGNQTKDEPCHMLSPIYGAFEIADGDGANMVCRQAVPQNPGPNAWTHRQNGWPIALFPSGTNYASYVVSVRGQFESAPSVKDEPAAISLCGRVPIFAPAKCQPKDYSLGVCLTLMMKSTTAITWRVTEAQNQYHGGCSGFHLLGNGTLNSQGTYDAMDWYNMTLDFSEGTVRAIVNGIVLGSFTTSLTSGVAAIGTAWNTAIFDSMELKPHTQHPPTPNSFLFDVLPASFAYNTLTGYAGMILDLSSSKYTTSLTVTGLGRFKVSNNSEAHQLGIFRKSDGQWLLAPSDRVMVNFSHCTTDILGFCYSTLESAVTLTTNETYYIVSSENNGGDAFLNMTFSATGADYASYRSGDTFMSYKLPSGLGGSLVTGKVYKAEDDDTWTEIAGITDIDTSFGPINMILS
eukprot:m.42146 g.42146  ORF g.42146 m.42146 type:complete len:1030 (+) comp9849_c0_seq2:322-3411(+)